MIWKTSGQNGVKDMRDTAMWHSPIAHDSLHSTCNGSAEHALTPRSRIAVTFDFFVSRYILWNLKSFIGEYAFQSIAVTYIKTCLALRSRQVWDKSAPSLHIPIRLKLISFLFRPPRLLKSSSSPQTPSLTLSANKKNQQVNPRIIIMLRCMKLEGHC